MNERKTNTTISLPSNDIIVQGTYPFIGGVYVAILQTAQCDDSHWVYPSQQITISQSDLDPLIEALLTIREEQEKQRQTLMRKETTNASA